MIKKIVIFIGILLIPFWMLVSYPYIWKLTGGSFVWDNKAIYQGKELFEAADDCAISFTHELENVTLYCGDNKRTWVHGEEIKKVKDRKDVL